MIVVIETDMILTPRQVDERAAVVREAVSWIGTPWQHASDIKGAGVDCGMLLVRVFVDVGLAAPFDPRPYARDFMLHKSEQRFMGFVHDRCARVEQPMFGDVVLFHHGKCLSHGGIVVGWPFIVHASNPRGCVLVEDVLRSDYAHKERIFYSYWARRGGT